jgi:hypothetical protein
MNGQLGAQRKCGAVSSRRCVGGSSPSAYDAQWLGFAIERGCWDEGFVSGFSSNRAQWSAYESAVEVPTGRWPL